ncbi:hypothetical protein CDL15_Pgr010479 [Punica granatum]|uniref:Uncharacterized protein n=1 Tax=Punica granatum TaxID=22663 RepID=A0A218XW40_PUNGR|nr:hypothetical protein CDL15_Pgr010479 [Punica granatum]
MNHTDLSRFASSIDIRFNRLLPNSTSPARNELWLKGPYGTMMAQSYGPTTLKGFEQLSPYSGVERFDKDARFSRLQPNSTLRPATGSGPRAHSAP